MTWASRWVGRPAAEFGAEACYGLVRRVLAEEFGIHWPVVGKRTPSGPADRAMWLHWHRPLVDVLEVERRGARPGDVVLMRHGRHPAHLGIVPARGWLLHLPDTGESVCVRLDDPSVRRRVVAVYRPHAAAADDAVPRAGADLRD